MKIGLQFAMPVELHALPGAKDWTPFETVSGVPFFDVEKDEGGRPVRALEKALITALRHNAQKLNEFNVI